MAVLNLPPAQIPVYATTGDLPAGVNNGAQAVVAADDSIYIYNGTAWIKQGGGGGSVTGSGTANGATYFTGATSITSTAALTNGQILVGSTGLTPVATTITGTTNQVNVTNGAGSITLATPQNINTSATPTFASETLTANTNQLTLGTTNTTTVTMASLTGSRTFTLPDANSNSVIPSTASAHNFATGISSGGAVSYAQPATTDVSYTPTTSSNWSSVPSTSQAALDDLATSGVFKNQTANTVLAGPATGAAANPAFRALVAADIPALVTTSFAQEVFVSTLSGSDSTGTGTYINPYKTIAHACTQITDSSSTKPYIIKLTGARQEETSNILLPPYVGIEGSGQRISFIHGTGGPQIKPATALGSANSWNIIKDVYVSGTVAINWDLQAIGGSNCVLVLDCISCGGSLTYKGRNAGGGDSLEIYNSLIFGAVTLDSVNTQSQGVDHIGAVIVTDTQVAGTSATFINVQFDTSLTTASNLTLSHCAYPGTSTFTTTAAKTITSFRGVPPSSRQTLFSGTTITEGTDSTNVPFTPTTSANWNSVPALVQTALDTLATSGVVKSQSQNLFLASPNGSSGVPSFRSIATADLPNTTILTTGANAWAANQSLGGFLITNSGSPVNPGDLTSKSYVDNLAQGLSWKEVTRSATTTTLPAYTYNNGTSGVGATLTGNSNGALTAQDGVTLASGNRLLVKNETGTNQPYNGIYTLTQVGDITHPYILTRATDADTAAKLQWATVEVGPDASTQAGYIYRESSNITTIGTDNTNFANVSQGLAYTFTSGVQQIGSTVSAHVDNTTIDVNGSNQIEVKTGGIANTQIASGAAIARNKLAALTANRAMVTDGSGFDTISATTDTEIGYVSGVTSSIQTQLNGKVGTVGTIDSQAASANGLVISGSSIYAQSASASNPGLVNTTSQTLAGVKTFSSAPNFSSLTASTALVLDGSQNVASLAYSATGGTSNLVSRDANGNSRAVNWVSGATNVVSAGGTTILTAASTRVQQLTGSANQTFQLPDATTLAVGATYDFNNNSTGILSIVDNGSNAITSIPAGGNGRIIAIAVSTANGSWDKHFLIPSNSSWGTAGAVVTGTLSATSETLTANTNQLVLGTTNTTTMTMASLTGSRTFTFPDANSNSVQPLGSATSHQWIQYIDSTGTQHLSQPAFSDISGTASLTTQVSGILPIANGGTNVSSVTTVPTATAFAGWDANKNLSANSFIDGYTTTATAAGTSTLTVSSTKQQYFTGSTTQTVVLPVTSTLVLGQQYQIVNNSSGAVTVQSSGANTVQVMAANSVAYFTVILTSGTTAASWNVEYSLQNAAGTVTSVAVSGGTTGLTTSGGPITTSGTITISGTLAVANGGTGVTTSTGTGNVVLSNSPTLVTPALGTPASGVLTNATGLPLTTGVTGTLPIANGGTNSVTSLNNNRVMISNSSAIVEASAITANRALTSDSNGIPVAAPGLTTDTEIGYVHGVTSAIQTQLNAKETSWTTTAVSSNITLADHHYYLVDTSAARSLTVPAPTNGLIFMVKDSTFTANTNNITILRNGTEKIEGVANSYIMDSNGQSITLLSNGTDWFII